MKRHIIKRFSFDWNTNRIEALTDGVFAIAMTLLVLNIGIDDTTSHIPGDVLHGKLLNLWPNLLHYFESFIILAVFWIKHHQQYHLIKQTDRAMMWINILGLLFICLIPFSTSLVGDFGHHRVAAIIFESNLFIAGVIYYYQWAYATKDRRHVARDLDINIINAYKFDNMVVPVASVIAVIISIFSDRWGTLIYILVPLFFLFSGKREETAA